MDSPVTVMAWFLGYHGFCHVMVPSWMLVVGKDSLDGNMEDVI